MDWLCVAWSWWELFAPAVGLVEFGVLTVGTVLAYCYRRSLRGRIDAQTKKTDELMGKVDALQRGQESILGVLERELGSDHDVTIQVVRIAGKGSAEFSESKPVRLTAVRASWWQRSIHWLSSRRGS